MPKNQNGSSLWLRKSGYFYPNAPIHTSTNLAMHLRNSYYGDMENEPVYADIRTSVFISLNGDATFEITERGQHISYVEKNKKGYSVELSDPYENTYRNFHRRTLRGAQSVLDRHMGNCGLSLVEIPEDL